MDAVLPLIGVVIGAVLGGGMTYLLDKRRERRTARAGLRLVVHELEATKLRWHSLTESWDDEPTAENADRLISDLKNRPYATALWKNHQEVLASSLSGDEWEGLADAYKVIRAVEDAVQTGSTAEDWMELPDVMKAAQEPLDAVIERLQASAR
jgi:hypothetical protein